MNFWLSLIFLGLIGCRQTNPPPAIDQVRNQFMLIDGGSRRIEQKTTPTLGGWALTFDTMPVPRGEMYRNQPEQHPLTPFYLSYPEWKTIQCIIAIDESDYWDKAMIGLIQQDGLLRIQVQQQDFLLRPVKKVPIRAGDWSNTYHLDSIEIRVNAHFKAEKIMNSLTGNGLVKGHVGTKNISESAFFVFKRTHRKS
jgi:hypothetical protein